jgi:hypothetical protein
MAGALWLLWRWCVSMRGYSHMQTHTHTHTHKHTRTRTQCCAFCDLSLLSHRTPPCWGWTRLMVAAGMMARRWHCPLLWTPLSFPLYMSVPWHCTPRLKCCNCVCSVCCLALSGLLLPSVVDTPFISTVQCLLPISPILKCCNCVCSVCCLALSGLLLPAVDIPFVSTVQCLLLGITCFVVRAVCLNEFGYLFGRKVGCVFDCVWSNVCLNVFVCARWHCFFAYCIKSYVTVL